VLDYLLMDLYPSEDDIALVQQGKAASPVGVSRKASGMPLPRGLDAFGADVPVGGPAASAAASSASAASAASVASAASMSAAAPVASAISAPSTAASRGQP
jgi:penicillin-binding protein 2